MTKATSKNILFYFALTVPAFAACNDKSRSIMVQSSPADQIRYEPATLDFRDTFDAQLDVDACDSSGNQTNSQAVLELLEMRTAGKRFVTAQGTEGKPLRLSAKNVQSSDRAKLWIYERKFGLTVYSLAMDELRLTSPLRFQPLSSEQVAQSTVVKILDANGKPRTGFRVGVSKVLAPFNGIEVESEVPDELWEVSQEITDTEGIATLKTAFGVEVIEIKLVGKSDGTQRVAVDAGEIVTHRIVPSGSMEVILDEAVELETIHELVFMTNTDERTYGFHRIKNPTTRTFKFQLMEGSLSVIANYDSSRQILTAPTPCPLSIEGGKNHIARFSMEGGCEVSGHVVSMVSGENHPVAGVAVRIATPSALQFGRNILTDLSGKFTTRIPAGDFQIGRLVTTPSTALSFEDGASLEFVAKDAKLDLGNLALQPISKVSGRAVDSDDKPLAYAEISCVNTDGMRIGGGKANGEGIFTAHFQGQSVAKFSIWPRFQFQQYSATIENSSPLLIRATLSR